MASGTIAISRLDAVASSCVVDPAERTGLLQATAISDQSADRNRATAMAGLPPIRSSVRAGHRKARPLQPALPLGLL
jgi:hypothetical protein